MAVSTTPPRRASPLKRKRSLSPGQPSRLPAPLLLLALPALLLLPPTHPHHLFSLRLSLLAVRRCLQLRDQLAPAIECRAWAAFVELGMKVIGAGLSDSGPEGLDWARGLENEVATAIGKGLMLSQAHPGLRSYAHHLTLLHAHLSHWQHDHKFARALLKRHIASLSTSDPPAHHYATHLASVAHALAANPVDLPSALHGLSVIQVLADHWGHADITLLGQVIRLRVLISALDWAEAFPLLSALESSFHLVFPDAMAKPEAICQHQGAQTPSALQTCFELHVLTLGILAHVQAGRSKDANARLARLHAALDAGVLEKEGIRDGVIEVPLGSGRPLRVLTTHPRVFFHLAFLVSAVSMRDATGRRPKRKVFAAEGLAQCERERPKDTLRGAGRYPRWAGLRERQDVEERLAKIEADLLSELAGVCIQRGEFEEAEEHLARLIAHTRTHALWEAYSAPVMLQHAYLAHGQCNRARALQCYRAAAHLAAKGEKRGNAGFEVRAGIAVSRFVRLAAQAGEVGLRLGLARTEMGPGEALDDRLRKWGADVAKECRAVGGTLEAVGRVLQACLADEIVVAKTHLKASLHLTTDMLDNHLRALVLALTSSHYLHTSSDYAEVMLTTARQLAAGLGAPSSKHHGPKPKSAPRKVGNAPLGFWVGQRFLELYRRTGRDAHARKQEAANEELSKALKLIEQKARHDGCERDADGDVRIT